MPTFRPRHLSPAALTVASLAVLVGFKLAESPGGRMATFGRMYLDGLDDAQRSETTLPFADASRVGWHFFPMADRKGLPLRDMNDAQRTAALRLVRAALSEFGYEKTHRVRMLESVVADLEGPDRNWSRDPGDYYVTLFGTPGETEPWGLSFEGHHISMNFTCRDGVVVDGTPQFLGAHPAAVPDDYTPPGDKLPTLPAGIRVLAEEEDAGFDLVAMLDADQRAAAIVAEEAPAEVRFVGDAQAGVEGEPVGIAYADLRPDQKKQLKFLVSLYTDIAADTVAEKRRRAIEDAGWDNVHFAWMGATDPGIGHYYRVRGPTFLIELNNNQPDALGNPANHVHTVLRDLTGDFDLPPAN